MIPLNDRVVIQQRGSVQDEYGAPVESWADVVTVWANVSDLSGREYFAAQATQNTAQTKITIRHREGITSDLRVLHDGNIYNIESVLGQDKKTLLLMCSRRES